ncbi:MAG: tetratricopeptide repeat protein [Burkholderiaceae bacterium]
MSVIHSVLTRLDARGAARPDAMRALPVWAGAPASGASRRLLLLSALGAAAIGFAAFGDWPAWLRGAQAAQVAPTPAGAPEAARAAASATAPGVAETPAPPLSNPARTPARMPARQPAARVAVDVTPDHAVSEAPARRVAALSPPRTAVAHDTAALAPADPAATPPTTIDKRDVAPSPAARALQRLRQAQDAAQAGQPRSALEQARAALAIDPALSPARQLAAVLEHETGHSERALQLLREGLARNPQDGAQALLLARVLLAQGDAPAALATLDGYAVRGAEADGLRGGVLTQQGDTGRAVPAYESAARQQPTNPMWWLGLGVALDAQQQPQRARQAFARALSIGLPRDDLAQYAEQRVRATD